MNQETWEIDKEIAVKIIGISEASLEAMPRYAWMYTKGLNCAWEVVDKMREKGYWFSIQHEQLIGPVWKACFSKDGQGWYGRENTPALAICKASLSALEHGGVE